MIKLLIPFLQPLKPLLLLTGPVRIGVEGKRVIRHFFIFRDFLTEEFRYFEFLIEGLEFDIREDDP